MIGSLRIGILAVVLALSGVGPGGTADKDVLLMATTTSTDATGFLDALAPKVRKTLGIDLRWVATGTGKALELGKRCDVDMVLVHAPRAEKDFVKAGYGIDRRRLMYNDFVLVGPPGDPAFVKGTNIQEALRRLVGAKAGFVSRGDDSGTHMKERELWQAAGIDNFGSLPGYVETGQGMMATLDVAVQRRAYTLTDRATLAKFLDNPQRAASLAILVEGSTELLNRYSIITVNPEKCPKVKTSAAKRFTDWMTAPEGQASIESFRVSGKPIFFPDAEGPQ
ncbi:substrate-binding domain-containing protein [Desulfosoma caldarium]|uniref:Tungstate transport system substrate-binding protein n=1 Tax=Desulfosoma caldarium TaxID=610254 RepID=A0A3N1VQH1_9BACT|nr:substrate-binding domain-containing protein [Desulfosoma caldarium]ROR03318.1 tungstate transport system substrate-binding protein [Desulfosoma caldarium]